MMFARSLALGATAAALVLGAAPLAAQQAPPVQRNQPGAQAPGQNRQMLERQVRARIQRVMRESLQLTDDQAAQLERTMRMFENRRRQLLREERSLRQSLRAAMGGPPAAAQRGAVDERAIALALDSLLAVQRRRIELLEEEQRELATFLTPLQRAQYFALQDNLRRMLEERASGTPGGRPGGRPPGPGGDPPTGR